MQNNELITEQLLQKVQKLKKKIDTKKFCELHGISESKFSRFPSEKFVKELELIDYMEQFYEFYKQLTYYISSAVLFLFV